ncbi:MAG: hypothetical protein AABW41_00730 [Nanoarchaeota archaeon]
MVNMTLALSDKLHNKMKQFSDIKWTEVARRAIETKIEDLEALENLVSKSKLTQRDIEKFSKKIKTSAARKFMEG